MQKYKSLIIDGNNFLFRAYYGKGRTPRMVNEVNVAPGCAFLHQLKELVTRHESENIYMAWDQKTTLTPDNYRSKLVDYKGQRVESEEKIALKAYINHLQPFMDALGVVTVRPHDLEADDVIAFFAFKEQDSALIVSSDKDLMQLVTPKVHVYQPLTGLVVTPENFEEAASVPQQHFVLFKAIMGDKSDNIPGIPKYGPVHSKRLAGEIMEGRNNNIKLPLPPEHAMIIERNIRIMNLKYARKTCPEEYQRYEDQFRNSEAVFDAEVLKDLFRVFGMHDCLSSFGTWNRLFNRRNDNYDLLSMISM